MAFLEYFLDTDKITLTNVTENAQLRLCDYAVVSSRETILPLHCSFVEAPNGSEVT